jgi:hypothetical protein
MKDIRNGKYLDKKIKDFVFLSSLKRPMDV